MASISFLKPRSFGIEILHVFAVVGIAVAQPIYSTLAGGGGFFVANDAGALQVVVLAFILSIGLPLVIAAAEAILRLINRRAQRLVHLAVIWFFLALLALQLVNRYFTQSAIVPISLAVVAAAICTVFYARSSFAGRLLTFLSLGALLFPLNFLLISPISKLVLSPQPAAVADAGVDASNAKTPVVLVIFDEFNPTALLNKEGQIDAVRYPHFAQLAATSWWFPRATSTAPQTQFAVPAILSGKYPDPEKSFPSYRDHPNNLFTMLGNDYVPNVHESLTSLCPDTICSNDDSYFSWKTFISDISVVYAHAITPPTLGKRLLPSLSNGWNDFRREPSKESTRNAEKELVEQFNSLSDESRSNRFSDFIHSITGDDKTINFLHILLPHVPYQFLPDGTHYQRTGEFGINEGVWSTERHFLSFGYKRYLMQVGFVDHMIGELIQRLKSVNAFDKSLIIITADHGKSFKPGIPERALVKDNMDILHVPLFIKLPNQKSGEVDRDLVSNMDITPTIADVLGIKLNWSFDGTSVFSNKHEENRELSVTFRSEQFEFDRNAIVSLPLLEWQTRTFDSGTPLSSLTIASPYSDLVGKRVDSLDVVDAPEEQTPRLTQNFSILSDIDPSSDFRPSLVSSAVTNLGEVDQPWIALALNDRITAVTQVYKDASGSDHILALFPPGAITAGRNTLAAFQVLDSEGSLKFRRVLTGLGTYALEHQGTHEILESPQGDGYPISSGKGLGYVDRARLDGTILKLIGWSANVAALEPAKVIAVFMNGKFVCAASPNVDRSDVAKHFKSAKLEKSGFSTACVVDRSVRSLDSMRVFGITSSGTAGELSFSNN